MCGSEEYNQEIRNSGLTVFRNGNVWKTVVKKNVGIINYLSKSQKLKVWLKKIVIICHC